MPCNIKSQSTECIMITCIKRKLVVFGNVSFSIDWIFQHCDGREDSQLRFSSRLDQSGAQLSTTVNILSLVSTKKVGCGIAQKKSTGRHMEYRSNDMSKKN